MLKRMAIQKEWGLIQKILTSRCRPFHLVAEQRHIFATIIGKIQAIELRLLEAVGTSARLVVCSHGPVVTPGRLPMPASALAFLTNLCKRGIGGNLPHKRKIWYNDEWRDLRCELRLLEADGTTARIVVCSHGTVITPGRMPMPTSALAYLIIKLHFTFLTARSKFVIQSAG